MQADLQVGLDALGKRLAEWQAHQQCSMEAVLAEHRRLEACLQGLGTTPRVDSATAQSCNTDRPIAKEAQRDEGLTIAARQLDDAHAVPSTLSADPLGVPAAGSWSLVPRRRSSLFNRDLRRVWTDLFAGGIQQQNVNRSLSDSQQEPMLKTIVSSKTYEMALMVIISLNMVFIGAQVQDAARSLPSTSYEEPWFMTILEFAFVILFAGDILLHLRAFGCSMYRSEHAPWHIFDLVVVVMMLLELIEKHLLLAGDSPLKFATLLRTLRAIRIVRAIRMIRFLQGRRVLLLMVLVSMKAVMWSGVLIVAVVYIYGVMFAQGVVDFCLSHGCDDPAMDGLLYRFGGIDLSSFSLFLAMTSGASWEIIYDVLKPLPRFYSFVFIFYVGIAYFAILNIVTGVFVESAVHVAGKDREAIVAEEVKNKRDFLEMIGEVFVEMDADHSGEISLQEIHDALLDERLLAYFNALELDISDVTTLFKMLDRDKTGSIDLGEFLQGCMRLRGEAKTFDLAKLQYQTEWVMHSIDVLREELLPRRCAKNDLGFDNEDRSV